jgi:hypothetical protein
MQKGFLFGHGDILVETSYVGQACEVFDGDSLTILDTISFGGILACMICQANQTQVRVSQKSALLSEEFYYKVCRRFSLETILSKFSLSRF